LAEAPDAVAQWNQKFTPFSYGLLRESLHLETAGHNAGETLRKCLLAGSMRYSVRLKDTLASATINTMNTIKKAKSEQTVKSAPLNRICLIALTA
jgi:hypothetical protein